MAQGNPPVHDEEEMPKLPEPIEIVRKPTLRHRWAAVIVAPGAIVDTTNRRDAPRAVLLARVADSLDDLLVLWHIQHALGDVLHRVLNGLGGLELHGIET